MTFEFDGSRYSFMSFTLSEQNKSVIFLPDRMLQG